MLLCPIYSEKPRIAGTQPCATAGLFLCIRLRSKVLEEVNGYGVQDSAGGVSLERRMNMFIKTEMQK